ncbi:PAS domain-containing protein [Natronolimnobius sp. AArcel1]|uniref:methyl-accepting chemotaxis protein n=1 Tax=Natronolimnobius sp. AArcel1 TaxID=1679093 RepID=UPI0013EC6659|nr:methyl-accepting chemotaxis protein [Natronolimnobius sp. AArcel1]NGM70984.1 PAS domain-containing protein [Natronolimnobius sp. AArcel1]
MLSLLASVVGNSEVAETDENASGPGRTEPTEVSEDELGAIADHSIVSQLVDGFAQPVTVVDADGRIVMLNTAAADLYGTTASPVADRHPDTLHDIESEASDIVTEALEQGNTIHEREEHSLINGEEVFLERTVTLLESDAGEVCGAILVETDVSERRRQRNKNAFLEAYNEQAMADFQTAIERLARGDLTVELTVPEPDEEFDEAWATYEEYVSLQRNLEQAVSNIRETVATIESVATELADSGSSLGATTEEVTNAIDGIDASSSELANGADEMTTEAQRASESVSDLSASIEEITASIGQINTKTEQVTELANDGVGEADAAVTQIRDANESTAGVAQRIDDLEESMQEVGEIVELINDIADQTNLLALNASIEAATAGEDGDGFAVVANEVKSLAEDSQDSASEIGTIIDDIQAQTADLVRSIREASAEVEDGADSVADIVDRLERINERAARTSEDVAQITDAVESQAQNAEEVSVVIDETAGLSEEMTATTEAVSSSLEEQTEAMTLVADRAQRFGDMSEDIHGRLEQFKLDADDDAALDVDS